MKRFARFGNMKKVTFSFIAEACNLAKSNTPLWVFFTIFNLCIWYQIAQSATYEHKFFTSRQ